MRKNTVLIAVIGHVGNEPETIRQTLEHFGFTVVQTFIGRPKDLTDLLEGRFPIPFDYLILSCHGENGAIVMPVLDESVYFSNEHRGDFSVAEVERSLRLTGKVIINSGCTTGSREMCHAFSGGNVYIAPRNYVEGNAAVFFIIRLFYELSKGRSLPEATALAQTTDEETALFEIAGQG